MSREHGGFYVTTSGPGRLVLNGPVAENVVPFLRQLLEEAVGEHDEVCVDLDAVTYLPSAAAGVLVVARAHARRRGGRLILSAGRASQAGQVLGLLGLSFVDRLPEPEGG